MGLVSLVPDTRALVPDTGELMPDTGELMPDTVVRWCGAGHVSYGAMDGGGAVPDTVRIAPWPGWGGEDPADPWAERSRA